MKLRTLAPPLLLGLAMALPRPATAQQLRLSRLVADGMVMQRDARVPVWGWAAPGARVQVTFDGRPHSATADAEGAWRVVLPALPAGGPHAMTVSAGGQTVEVRDILVGDVWIASGQSNMEWRLADANGGPQEAARANETQIREFKVPQSFALAPEKDLQGGSWSAGDPAHAGQFSAVAWYFARDLRPRLGNVPIGIINTSWGGSRIEPWMSPRALGTDEAGLARIEQTERESQRALLDTLRARMGGELPTQDRGMVDGRPAWADAALDESAWTPIPVPSPWENAGFPGMDGTAWYRTSFDLTAQEAAAGVKLGLGMIDDSDVTWVNGHEVGHMDNAWNQARVYEVPASALRAGRNVIAVRVQDFQGGGGMAGAPEQLYVEARGARRSLAGNWKFRVGAVAVSFDGRNNQLPTRLWNAMVSPIVGYPVKGAIWYQGESNAGSNEEALAYRTLFPTMIRDWRAAWGQEFPFLWVQLANYMAAPAQPQESSWARLRESQSATLSLPATGQAVIIDIGEAGDIHPRNKKDVGLRLARAARHVAYGESGFEWSGPTYRAHRIDGNRVIVEMDHAGGLRARAGGEVHGFAVAGADRRWAWARARVENGRVVVWSDAVRNPVAVRYAWADNPDDADLYNADGLPASPFRTDDW